MQLETKMPLDPPSDLKTAMSRCVLFPPREGVPAAMFPFKIVEEGVYQTFVDAFDAVTEIKNKFQSESGRLDALDYIVLNR